MMKKVLRYIAVMLTMILPTMLYAQVNPQKGYIITHENDTIHGTIDYLTDAQNVKACLFQKDGESEYKTLTPKDIKGYRLAGDGIYYVSRIFTGSDEPELVFAEFLLQGGMSLYRYYYENTNYFGFVDSEGKEAIMQDDKLNSDLRSYNHKLQGRRQKVQEVNALMNQDNTIATRLWKMDLTSETLTRMVKQYDEQYCTEAGDCVLFRYDKEKAITVKYRFYVGAGICYGSFDSPTHDIGRVYNTRYSEYSYSGIAPTFFIGTDFKFPRFSRNLDAQLELSYTPHRYESSEESMDGKKPKIILNELTGRIGIKYTFAPESRIKPFINGGVLFSWNIVMKEENVLCRYKLDTSADLPLTQKNLDLDYGKGAKAGIYLGGGVDISHFRLSAAWKKTFGSNGGVKENGCVTLTAAYLF
jgi:hypothetical protein